MLSVLLLFENNLTRTTYIQAAHHDFDIDQLDTWHIQKYLVLLDTVQLRTFGIPTLSKTDPHYTHDIACYLFHLRTHVQKCYNLCTWAIQQEMKMLQAGTGHTLKQFLKRLYLADNQYTCGRKEEREYVHIDQSKKNYV